MSLRSYLRGGGLGILIAALVLTFSGTEKTKAMTDEEVKARALELGMTEGSTVLSEAYTVAEAPEVTGEASSEEEITEIVDTGGALTNRPAEELPQETPSEEQSSETASTEAASTETASTEAAAEESSSEAASDASADIIEESLKGQQTTSLTSDLTGEDKTKSELLADAVETEAESASPVTDSSSGFISIHINGGSTSTAVAKVLENAGAVSDAAEFDRFLCANGYDRRLSTGDFRIPAGAGDEEIARILMKK
ncbi:MAG: hypothetical protein K5668_04685 [Lachnospiraceae bacterium]|nr:hypothetical protein [Lachnospiraceae bacterium]